MKKIFILLIFCQVASPAEHSLMFLFTGCYGFTNFPEFVGVVMVDEVEVVYCDNNSQTAEPKQDWMKKLMEDDPEHKQYYTDGCRVNQHFFSATIDSLIQRFNRTGGVRTVQRMYGCEWDDVTEEGHHLDQYALDGDFLPSDLKPKDRGMNEWDNDNACLGWLKKYVDSGNTSLLRTELPSVSLLQKTPSSPVSCHATGFYPDKFRISWRKDEEELTDVDVHYGELLPNNDGTFQTNIDLLTVKSEDWKRYDCVFELSGVKEDIIIRLDKAVIRTNWGQTGITNDAVCPFPSGAVFIIVVLLLPLAVSTGLFIWERQK